MIGITLTEINLPATECCKILKFGRLVQQLYSVTPKTIKIWKIFYFTFESKHFSHVYHVEITLKKWFSHPNSKTNTVKYIEFIILKPT